MNPEVREKWLTALRSGEIEQAKSRLRVGEGRCCLGVLCDIAVDEGVIPSPQVNNKGEYVYGSGWDTSNISLPVVVQEWAGLDSSEPPVNGTIGDNKGKFPVSSFNDNGHTFVEIADLIEENL